jgi:hypothetical protein
MKAAVPCVFSATIFLKGRQHLGAESVPKGAWIGEQQHTVNSRGALDGVLFR